MRNSLYQNSCWDKRLAYTRYAPNVCNNSSHVVRTCPAHIHLYNKQTTDCKGAWQSVSDLRRRIIGWTCVVYQLAFVKHTMRAVVAETVQFRHSDYQYVDPPRHSECPYHELCARYHSTRMPLGAQANMISARIPWSVTQGCIHYVHAG